MIIILQKHDIIFVILLLKIDMVGGCCGSFHNDLYSITKAVVKDAKLNNFIENLRPTKASSFLKTHLF